MPYPKQLVAIIISPREVFLRCGNVIKHFKANMGREIAKNFITVKHISESRSEKRKKNGSCKREDW